jgi:TPR repeat protein
MRQLFSLALSAFVLTAVAAGGDDFEAGSAALARGDHRAAYEVWRPLAESGDPRAQFNVAMMHARGEGVAQDYVEAARWFVQAAEQGQAEAQARIGGMYAEGIGVERDDVEAARWLTEAAYQHHAASQYELGIMYANGQGVGRDYLAAYFWLQLAELQGFPDAAETKRQVEGLIHPTQRGMVERQVWDWLDDNLPPGDARPEGEAEGRPAAQDNSGAAPVTR